VSVAVNDSDSCGTFRRVERESKWSSSCTHSVVDRERLPALSTKCDSNPSRANWRGEHAKVETAGVEEATYVAATDHHLDMLSV